MNKDNPFFLDEEDPVDALHRIGYLLRFLRELQGHTRDGLELSTHAQEGFRFLLVFLEDTIRQIAYTIMKKRNWDVDKEKETGVS